MSARASRPTLRTKRAGVASRIASFVIGVASIAFGACGDDDARARTDAGVMDDAGDTIDASGGDARVDASIDASVRDGSIDDDARTDDDAGGWIAMPPAPPEIAWLPSMDPVGASGVARLTPCPAGWTEVAATDDRVPARCDPYPDGEPDCAGDSAHFPGESACGAIGSACAADGWPSDLPATGVVYVREGAELGGDGTRARPYRSLTDVWPDAPEDTIVALAEGRYVYNQGIPNGADVRGACVERTSLSLVVVGSPEGGRLTLRNLAIDDDLVIDGDVTVTAEAVLHRYPVVVESGAYVGRRVVSRVGAGIPKTAFSVTGGSTLELATGVIEGAAIALYVRDVDSSAMASDVAVLGGGARASASTGAAVQVERRGRVRLERTVILSPPGGGVSARGNGGHVALELEDVVIAHTDPSDAETDGNAILVSSDAEVTLDRVFVDDARSAGLRASLAPGVVVARDLVIRAPIADAAGTVAQGIAIQDGVTFDAERVHVHHALGLGIAISRGTATLTDVVVTETTSATGARDLGNGVRISNGARVAIDRARIDGAREAGLLAIDPLTDVEVHDVVVTDVRMHAAARLLGGAIGAASEATLRGSRIVVHDVEERGVVALDGAAIDLSDIVVRDVRSNELGIHGRGVHVQSGASLVLLRALVERTREIGIAVTDLRTRATLASVEVRETREQSCVETSCAGLGFGVGIGVYDDAMVTAARFRLIDDAYVGLQLAYGGNAMELDGEIVGHPYGAHVVESEVDLEALFARVAFRENETNVQSGEGVAVPMRSAPE